MANVAINLQPLVRGTGLRSDVVTQVVAAVFEGRIKAGDRLVVQKLAQQLGVSATPVREALVELETTGIVDLLPNRGAVCRPFGPQQLREIYQIRRILEAEATHASCGRIPDDELERVRDESRQLLEASDDAPGWSDSAMALDQQLHNLVSLHSGSDRLGHELARYATLMHAVRQYVHNRLNVQRRAIEDHLEILDALIERDADKAAAAMSKHIRNTANHVVQLMFPSPTT
ncbi:MAG: GntR family transcriptional regulator [Phycisphaeraceae bacterium]